MGKLFGGSKQTSTSSSSNRAFDQLNQTFSPLTGQAATGANALAALLGGDPSGFNAFKDATGFDAISNIGSRGITGNAAARGLLRSGSTGRALQQYGDTIQNQFANTYLDKLLQQAGIGLQAGNLISGAGQVGQSQQSSRSKPGIGGFLGGITSGIAASDRRLKKNIFKIGKLPSGLGLYQFRYLAGDGPYVGVMADEVKKLKPGALGPKVRGFMTVNYSKVYA